MNIAYIAEGIGLKKMGGEYKGPCPCCGGDDRFHIKEGRNGVMMVHCRYLCSYASIMRNLEDRGLVEKEPFERVGLTSSQRATIETDKVIMLIYEADKRGGREQTLADYRRYKLATERHGAMTASR
jgi:hypothetical protein